MSLSCLEEHKTALIYSSECLKEGNGANLICDIIEEKIKSWKYKPRSHLHNIWILKCKSVWNFNIQLCVFMQRNKWYYCLIVYTTQFKWTKRIFLSCYIKYARLILAKLILNEAR